MNEGFYKTKFLSEEMRLILATDSFFILLTSDWTSDR